MNPDRPKPIELHQASAPAEAMQLGDRPILGASPAFRQVLGQAARVAASDATVLICGETGTGKDLLARAIHAHSPRRDRPLVVVNCAALPATLVESELFGHEKGAFTGAGQRKPGRFERANGATLFLDEVGELPLEAQGKFLRALQEGEIEPLGSTRTLRVDVRILAASNRRLEDLVAQGTFRADLFYRLNVVPLTLPPLRERAADILPLAEHFLRLFQARFHKPAAVLSPASRERLLAYRWPGNVRELEHVIERAVLLSEGGLLTIELPASAPIRVPPPVAGPLPSLAEVERQHIERVLRETGGVIEGRHGAAAILRLNPSTLRSLLKRLGLR